MHRFITLCLAAGLAACIQMPEAGSSVGQFAPTASPRPTDLPTPTFEPTRPPEVTPTPAETAIPTALLGQVGPFDFVAAVTDEMGPVARARLSFLADGTPVVLFEEMAYSLQAGILRPLAEEPPAAIGAVGPGGAVWAFDFETTYRWQGTEWEPFAWDPVGTTPGNTFFDNSGRLWVATGRDVRLFDGEAWRTFTYEAMSMNPPTDGDAISRFVFAAVGDVVWVGECTFGGAGPVGGVGARWWDGDTWNGLEWPTLSNCITAITPAPDGTVWLDAGPIFYSRSPDDGVWTRYLLPDLPEGYTAIGQVTDLPRDPSGILYPEMTLCIETNCLAGLIRYRMDPASREWQTITTDISGESSLLFDSNGQGWLFAPGAVYRLAGTGLQPVNGLMPAAQGIAPDGRLWALGAFGEQRGLWLLSRE